MSPVARLIIVTLVLYAGAYVAFRQTHAEIWDRDKQTYVIFPGKLRAAALLPVATARLP